MDKSQQSSLLYLRALVMAVELSARNTLVITIATCIVIKVFRWVTTPTIEVVGIYSALMAFTFAIQVALSMALVSRKISKKLHESFVAESTLNIPEITQTSSSSEAN